MQAWASAGRYLPHYSVAQYESGTPIPVSSARAGDLLFWSSNGAPSGIHHVALYLGGGSFIEAPHTGAYVRYNSIYSWYPDFAVRL
jgi:cell wall-associated NlpC family hydrolase